ncbi:MAG: 50S ribosomal protein L25 [Myxococcota bacterium]|jgi:large subunit ribosomal protein L25|nr:50S ribosomal protein L25 [Myxococcota bacterium]
METVEIKAVSRPGIGKGPARQERMAGRVPAVVYQGGEKAQHFSLDEREFAKGLLHGRNTLFELDLTDLDQGKQLALVKEVQRHPLRPAIVHVDFLAVSPESEVVVEVPIELEGTPEGVRLGGRLSRHERKAKVRCQAAAIPRAVIAKIDGLMPAETLLLSKVQPPEGTKLVFRHDLPVASVTTIAAATDRPEEAAPAAGGAAGGAEAKAEKKDDKKKK